MSLIRIASSPEIDPEPVTLEQFMAHSRITESSPADPDIPLKLTAARVHVENDTNRALITSAWEWRTCGWPCHSYLEVPLGNLQSVASIVYTDFEGTEHTWDTANYRLSRVYTSGKSDCGKGRIHLAYGKSWPSEILDVGEPICVTLTCGWLTADDVPEPLKTAIQVLAGHWYEHREAVIVGDTGTIQSSVVEMAYESLVAPYRLPR